MLISTKLHRLRNCLARPCVLTCVARVECFRLFCVHKFVVLVCVCICSRVHHFDLSRCAFWLACTMLFRHGVHSGSRAPILIRLGWHPTWPHWGPLKHPHTLTHTQTLTTPHTPIPTHPPTDTNTHRPTQTHTDTHTPTQTHTQTRTQTHPNIISHSSSQLALRS